MRPIPNISDLLLDAAMIVGPGAAERFAEGKPVFTSSQRIAMIGPKDGIVFESDEEEGFDTAMDLQNAAVELGRYIPEMVLALKATNDMAEKKTMLSLIDSALEAHMKLNGHSSSAMEFNPVEAKEALDEFKGLIAMAKDLADKGKKFALV